jgi:peptide chain release factor 2
LRANNLDKEILEPGVWADPQRAQSISKELSSLKKLLNSFDSIYLKIKDSTDLIEILESEEDSELFIELSKDLEKIKKEIEELEFKKMLGGESDHMGAVLTINAGAGGTDAQDWAAMLLRMYVRWIEAKEYKYEIVDYQEGEEAGIKSATVLVDGEYAYGYLKAEIGIHRIVRISPFDSNARRHTSFAAVYVSPQVDDTIEIEIIESELKIDTFRAGGAGGQHVNTTDSAIRITHIPTGIVVQCQNERSQHKNKATALKILKSRLYERELEIRNEKIEKERSSKKKIEWGSQIRSYVLHPYKMVKDHRTDYEESGVEMVLDGKIDSFIYKFLLGNF